MRIKAVTLTELLYTRSSASHLLSVRRRNLSFGSRAFRVERCAQNMELYLFTSANLKDTLLSDVILKRSTFTQPILPLAATVMRPDSLLRLALHKSRTQILT